MSLITFSLRLAQRYGPLYNALSGSSGRIKWSVFVAGIIAIFFAMMQPCFASSCGGVVVPAGFKCEVFVNSSGMSNSYTSGMAFDSSGNMYYTTGWNRDIRVIDKSGLPITTISSNYFWYSNDVIFDDKGTLFFSDDNAFGYKGAVFRDPAGENKVLSIGFPNEKVPYGDPWGMAFPSNSNIAAGFVNGLYVANGSSEYCGGGAGCSSGIFLITDLYGDPVSTVFLDTAYSGKPHPIVDAMSLAFGPGGAFGNNLYVADINYVSTDGAVYTVNPSGDVELFAGGTAGSLMLPVDLVFSQNSPFGDFLYVSTLTGKIVRIDSSNGIENFVASPSSLGPIAFGPDGCLYAGELGGRILRICSLNQSPVANAGPDQTIQLQSCSGITATPVTLDGSASYDPDGDALTYKWTWVGGSADGVNPTINLPYGKTTVTLAVDDGKGGASSDTVDISIVDTAVPTLNVTVNPNILWPPNHKYVEVLPSLAVNDACIETTKVELVSVTSSEPDNGLGDGDTANDIVINADGSILLRAERSGRGDGRIYTITYRATDAAGNSTTASATVTVPHNK